tara:strand:+ start:838 stop:1515 length:678 start_codon:yes stop_codon:yes gene_type:complete
MNKFLIKGAMFGLDARIALAIFGALSVISGAALYSAIENSKITQYGQFYIEMGKAFESFYIDTAKVPENGGSASPCAIIKPGIEGAKTPYLPSNFLRENNATAQECINHIQYNLYIDDPIYFNLGVDGVNGSRAWFFYDRMTTKDWTQSNSINKSHEPCTDSSCGLYFRNNIEPSQYTSFAPILSVFKKIDEYIDGSLSPNSGRFRYKETYPAYAYLLIPQVPKP